MSEPALETILGSEREDEGVFRTSPTSGRSAVPAL